MSVCLSIQLSISLSNHPTNIKMLHARILLPVILLFTCLSVCLYINLSIHLSIYPFHKLTLQWYMPESCCLLFSTVLRKNSAPSGSSTMWSGLATRSTTMPSLYQVTKGSGSPRAPQFRVAGSPRLTDWSAGFSFIVGIRPEKKGQLWRLAMIMIRKGKF